MRRIFSRKGFCADLFSSEYPLNLSSQPNPSPAQGKVFFFSLFGLALPIALQMLLQSFMGMADVIMVGDLGSGAIAAVGLAAKIHFLLLVLMSGLATGCSILVAQYSGAKDFGSCKKTLATTLFVGTLVMLPFTLIFGLGAPWWVHWINPDQQVTQFAVEYLVISAPIILLAQWILIYEASLRALGNTTMPLFAGALAAMVNIVLNYVLIGGHWGFPALGVAGAAWATLLSRLLQLFIIVAWVYLRKHGFALNLLQLRQGADVLEIRRYLTFALPLLINYAIWAVGNSTYHLVTGFAGTNALAVMGVMAPVESAFFALFIGFANASAVFVGRELGAGNNNAAWYLHQFFERITFIFLIIFCSALWFSRTYIIQLFSQLEPQAAELLFNTLGVFSLLVSFKIINMMRIIGVLRAGGDNRFPLMIDGIAMWGVGLPIFVMAVFLTDISFGYLYGLIFLEELVKYIPVIRRIHTRRWMNNLTGS